jgi:hypothetical protein
MICCVVLPLRLGKACSLSDEISFDDLHRVVNVQGDELGCSCLINIEALILVTHDLSISISISL